MRNIIDSLRISRISFSEKGKIFDWHIIPGRNCSHVFQNGYSICGHSAEYTAKDLVPEWPTTKRCEQCLITLATQLDFRCYRYFVGHIPTDKKKLRRQKWKDFLKEFSIKYNIER